MGIIKRNEYVHQVTQSLKTSEQYSLSAILCETMGSKDFFIRHEILAPGSRSSGAHFHLKTDEIAYVLKGSVVAHEGTEDWVLSPGDCICFNSNTGLLHFISIKIVEE